MRKLFLLAFASLLWAAQAAAQTTAITQPLQTLPPAPTCFICDCNSQDFSCRTGCAMTDFAARQQCLASCATQQAQCLANAQVLQRAIDTQRQAMLKTSLTAPASTTPASTLTTTTSTTPATTVTGQ